MAVACLKMSIVVIIPYYNESDTIIETLDSIAFQTRIPDSIIMVNSGCTDKTSEIIDNWIRKNREVNIKNLFSGKMSPSSSINLGIKSSVEDVIAYVDCGLKIPSNWIETSFKRLIEENADMVSLKIHTSGNSVVDKSFIAQTYGYKNETLCLPGSLIKRDVHKIVGLFKEKMRASYDVDFIDKFNSNNLNRSINSQATLRYYDTNYSDSLMNGARKVYSYSQNAWNTNGDKKPMIYLFIIGLSLITYIINLKVFIYLASLYLISRTILIPIYKSKKSIDLVISFNVIFLIIAGIIIDLSRTLGYIKSFILFSKQS